MKVRRPKLVNFTIFETQELHSSNKIGLTSLSVGRNEEGFCSEPKEH